ncbi:hypothetical protein DV737_g991, partial [Chaetothyriales sp. CBS 132003]
MSQAESIDPPHRAVITAYEIIQFVNQNTITFSAETIRKGIDRAELITASYLPEGVDLRIYDQDAEQQWNPAWKRPGYANFKKICQTLIAESDPWVDSLGHRASAQGRRTSYALPGTDPRTGLEERADSDPERQERGHSAPSGITEEVIRDDMPPRPQNPAPREEPDNSPD